jgi:hypothetical protein
MTTVYLPRTVANRRTPTKGHTLRQFLTAQGLDGQLDDVARYNWATTDPAEINRALVELVGCSAVQPDPLDSVLDPGRGAEKVIHVPTPWKPDAPLALEKTHTVKVKKRLPVPAVAITRMTAWFVPKTGFCEIEYALEGVSARADKVDFEVHATGYHEIGKGDALNPCDTFKSEAGTTHVFLTPSKLTIPDPVAQRRPPAAPKITWDGESVATQGILAPPTGKKAYVSHACAPYTVNLRYYKADADKKAKITLKPFLPRWKPPPNQATVEDASLVVEWEVKDDNAKLKAGQLLVVDKAGAVVFRAPLDEGKLRGGRYDLVADAVKWPKAGIGRAHMPYRAQIQAHSDENEEEGLAIAAMPTVVRAFQYDKVQFVAFNIKPGTKVTGTGSKTKIEYLGDPSDDNDLTRRCTIMKEAIRTAHTSADANADTLKIFMAPEFYFRGRDGAYALEKLSTIPKLMREETDKFEYVDWLFVLGTAIGYLDHEQLKKNQKGTGKSNRYQGEDKHNVVVEDVTSVPKEIRIASTLATPEVGWKILQGKNTRTIRHVVAGAPDKYTVTLDKLSGLAVAPAFLLEPVAVVTERKTELGVRKIKVRSKVCSRIPATVDEGRKAIRWLADQGWLTQSAITECVHAGGDEYWLSLSNNKTFAVHKSVTLIEPVATEVFNVSQVQRGWPSPALHQGLTAAVVDKESVSAIDYIGKNSSNVENWFAHDGIGRVIDIHGVKNRTVLPTEGSGALLGASPNEIEPGVAPDTWQDKSGGTHAIGSEINLTGIGGGSVLTMDGITFGVEVCLDHMLDRLHKFYTPTVAQAGDPKVQILLIPSWGMTIAGGKLVTPQDAARPGLVFNVDGSRCESAARATDKTYWCEDHPAQTNAAAVLCTAVLTPYVCATCHAVVSDQPGNCEEHPTVALTKHCYCESPKRFYVCTLCNKVVSGVAGNCTTHTTQVLDVYWECAFCEDYYAANGACTSLKHRVFVCTLCNKIISDVAGNCTTHLTQALDDWRQCPGCRKVRPAAIPCTCTNYLKYVTCGKLYPDGGACSRPPSTRGRHREPLQQIGTVIATTNGPTDVAGADAADLFMKKGTILIYAVKNLPAPDVVV